MVKGKIRVGKLFSWTRNFDVNKAEKIVKIIYYPDANTELHIDLTAESIEKLKSIRDDLKAIMDRTVDLEGTVVERWEKKLVTEEAKQVEKWVLVT